MNRARRLASVLLLATPLGAHATGLEEWFDAALVEIDPVVAENVGGGWFSRRPSSSTPRCGVALTTR